MGSQSHATVTHTTPPTASWQWSASLTGMTGLALPVVSALAVEVVDQVDAAAAVLTRVVFAFVDI